MSSILQGEEIILFHDGKYVNEIRETIMILLSECNVSMSKVNKVIQTVLKNLTGKIPEQLPSKGVLSRLLVEAKFIAQKQIAEAMVLIQQNL